MFIAYIVLTIIRTAQIIFSCIGKFTRAPRSVKPIVEGAKVPVEWLPWLAVCELAGAAGIVIGIFWKPLGIAAASGLVLYFIGAVVAHARVKDFRGMFLPVLPLLISVAVLVTRILA